MNLRTRELQYCAETEQVRGSGLEPSLCPLDFLGEACSNTCRSFGRVVKSPSRISSLTRARKAAATSPLWLSDSSHRIKEVSTVLSTLLAASSSSRRSSTHRSRHRDSILCTNETTTPRANNINIVHFCQADMDIACQSLTLKFQGNRRGTS